MARVIEGVFETTGRSGILCDFSPPRSGQLLPDQQIGITPNFIAVNYNPGQSGRANSVAVAAALRQRGHEVTFTLATRDMNRLALESLLLGAQVLGLENVLVVGGDPFGQRDRGRLKPVNDYRPTELIRAIARLNQGIDFRGASLEAPTGFCVGATIDLGRNIEREVALTRRKVDAGAQFLITQPVFEGDNARRFLELYAAHAGTPLPTPVFWGLQVLEVDGIAFGSVPQGYQRQLKQGRSGVDIAREVWGGFRQAGLNNVYLVPSIRRGGARDYAAAQQVIAAIKSGG